MQINIDKEVAQVKRYAEGYQDFCTELKEYLIGKMFYFKSDGPTGIWHEVVNIDIRNRWDGPTVFLNYCQPGDPCRTEVQLKNCVIEKISNMPKHIN